MFRSIKWYVKFVLTLIGKTPKLYQAKKILERESQEAFDAYTHHIVSEWAFYRVKDSGANIEVLNQERIPKDENVLFVSNHQSDFDIAVFLALVDKPVGFVAKIEMEKVPLLRDWMRNIHCVFMDRKDLKQSLQTILEGIKILKEGYSLVVFPEGTRSKTGKMGEFKAGSFKLATKSKVTIVPVTINGTCHIMEGSHYKITPADVEVLIHEPIYTRELSREELSALPERVRDIIEAPLLKTK